MTNKRLTLEQLLLVYLDKVQDVVHNVSKLQFQLSSRMKNKSKKISC